MVEVLNSNSVRCTKLLKEVDVTIEDSGDTFKTRYVIKHHVKDGDSYKLYEEQYNETIKYLLPVLKTKLFNNAQDFSRDNMLINSYCNEDIMVLKYRYLPFNMYEEFSKRLQKHLYFIRKQSTESNRMDLYFFQIPDKHKQEVKKFLHSEFNNFTKQYINKLVNFQNIKTTSNLYRVLIDDPELRNSLSKYLGCKIPRDIPLASKITARELWEGN